MRRAPIIFLVALLLILFFIVGVRYGQHVETANKQVDFLNSIPPTKTVPTDEALGFTTFSHNGCGISFLAPSNLSVAKNSTTGAVLAEGKTIQISFSCEKENPFGSDEAAVKTFKNTFTGKSVYFSVSKNLIPLIEKSLEFFAPKPTAAPTLKGK